MIQEIFASCYIFKRDTIPLKRNIFFKEHRYKSDVKQFSEWENIQYNQKFEKVLPKFSQMSSSLIPLARFYSNNPSRYSNILADS